METLAETVIYMCPIDTLARAVHSWHSGFRIHNSMCVSPDSRRYAKVYFTTIMTYYSITSLYPLCAAVITVQNGTPQTIESKVPQVMVKS